MKKTSYTVLVIEDEPDWEDYTEEHHLETGTLYKIMMRQENARLGNYTQKDIWCFLHNDMKVFHGDIKPDNMIYNLTLKPIGSYKADEIINLAKENNLVLTKTNGKKKTKKELYDEINLVKL